MIFRRRRVFNKNLFGESSASLISDNSEIVFVSDMFVDDYVGGAELTTQALIDSCPFNFDKIHTKKLTSEHLEAGFEKHWVFGNFAGLNPELIPTIVANMSYSVLEYDYKYCKYRSPEKHESIESQKCTCSDEMPGKMISAFLYGAKSLWWMSDRQMDHYHALFPFLKERVNNVLSSVFDDHFFLHLKILREKYKTVERSGWIVLGSTSWIKGAAEAEEWCKNNNKNYEVVWNVPYDELLEKLIQAEGFVYLPQGGDTCPRMVIEAKLLGCELHINDNVEHAEEIWFDTDDLFDTEAYLYAARVKFWSGIKHATLWSPKLSGYTTTLNCNKHDYPWRQSIKSMLDFCHEVVVVDGGSDDGTWKELSEWSNTESRLKVERIVRDWEHPRFAVFDGLQKAEARKRCTGDFCWQQDADEIVHENDYELIYNLIRSFPSQVDLVSLPVVEYWGKNDKVRMDVNPWKWRLSRNKPYITHGIPKPLRMTDDNGDTYASLGTDGCDYIDVETGGAVAHASFYNSEAHNLRIRALLGPTRDGDAIKVYSEWFNRCVELLPGVHHYSWYDLSRKIRTYRDYWSKHWQSLYNMELGDTSENNMFFQRPWNDVTDSDIDMLALKLEDEMGGWVFHEPVDFSTPTPHVKISTQQPKIMLDEGNIKV